MQRQEKTLNMHTRSDHKTDRVLYLELDINQTEKRFRQYAKDYNQELHNPEFLKEQYEIHKQYKVHVQESIKSLSIKNTHILTTISIIKAYYTHLKQIERGQITKEPKFAMNNVAIATMSGMCDRSSRRHVNKLLAIGFLEEKIFRGSNTSFILKINPEFLVARPKKELNELLLKQHVQRYPESPISSITLKYFNALRPSFSDFPEGIIRTVCPHVEITPDTYNNNILSKGIVDNSLHTKSKRPQKLSVINNDLKDSSCVGNPDNKNPEQTNVRHGADQNQDYQQKIRQQSKENVAAGALSLVFSFTDLAWSFVRSLLYENREFDPLQEQAAKRYIAGFFLEFAKNNRDKRISQAYNEFATTIQIIHEYTRRKIEWQIARPEYFFDPHFRGGFYNAFKNWLPKHKHQQKQNKEWNSHKKLVAQLFRYYNANPGFERYKQCTQRLGKLKNKKFLDIFNTCVLNQENYNTQTLNQQNQPH